MKSFLFPNIKIHAVGVTIMFAKKATQGQDAPAFTQASQPSQHMVAKKATQGQDAPASSPRVGGWGQKLLISSMLEIWQHKSSMNESTNKYGHVKHAHETALHFCCLINIKQQNFEFGNKVKILRN